MLNYNHESECARLYLNFSAPNLPTGLADLNVVVRALRVYNSALVLNLPFYSLGLYSIRQTVIIFFLCNRCIVSRCMTVVNRRRAPQRYTGTKHTSLSYVKQRCWASSNCVLRTCSGSVAIRYVLPGLWMTSLRSPDAA